MSDSPTLPTHHDPTHSTTHTPPKGAVDESDVSLRVGQTQTGCQTFMRFLKAAGLAIAGVAVFHGMLAAWVFLAGYAPNETFSVQSFQPFAFFGGVAAVDQYPPGYQAPDQVFPLDLTRQNYISVIGETKVMITQLPPHAEESGGAIIIDDIRLQDQTRTLVSLSDEQTHLDIEGSSDAAHTIRVVVPANVHTIPYLSLTGSDLTIEMDESVRDMTFDHLDITTDHLVSLPETLPEFGFLNIDTRVGEISGTFNVSHRLSLHVGTGSIDAQVHIVAPDRYDSNSNPVQVEATTDMGSIDLTVLSQAEDLESSIVGVTQMGVVRIQQTPHYVGGFVADIGKGEIKVSTKSPKVLIIGEDGPGHVEGSVRFEEKKESSEVEHETEKPSPIHCPPHCAPNALNDDDSSIVSIQTHSPYPEPTFTTLAEDAEPRYTIQTDPPYPNPALTGVAENQEPRYTIQTDPPYPEASYTIIASADVNVDADAEIDALAQEPRMTILPHASCADPTFTIVSQSPVPQYTIQTAPPRTPDVYTMHVRVGTPGVNIPTGVPYPEPSSVVITVPVPSSSSSPSWSASASSSSSKSGTACGRKHSSHTEEPTFTIQTDLPYPERTLVIQTDAPYPVPPADYTGPGHRRYSAQSDVPLEPTFAATIADQAEGGSEDRDPRAPMPTVNPLPPPPMRLKWGKHCPPICPPGYEDEDDVEEGDENSEGIEATIVGASDFEDGARGDGEIAEAEAEVEEVKEEDEQTHSDSAWPDPCHPPFCFRATEEPQTDTDIADLRDSVPRGGLVRGEAKLGSVELLL